MGEKNEDGRNGPRQNACPLSTASVCINAGHRADALISVHGMNRNIFYVIGVIVVIVIVLKLLGLF